MHILLPLILTLTLTVTLTLILTLALTLTTVRATRFLCTDSAMTNAAVQLHPTPSLTQCPKTHTHTHTHTHTC